MFLLVLGSWSPIPQPQYLGLCSHPSGQDQEQHGAVKASSSPQQVCPAEQQVLGGQETAVLSWA